jgi:hypothetical protein
MVLGVVLGAGVGRVDGAIELDEIKSLPGWTGALPSRQWSGYLNVPGDRGLKHYRTELSLVSFLSSLLSLPLHRTHTHTHTHISLFLSRAPTHLKVSSTAADYWFVESEGNPKTDPVALWLNVGPYANRTRPPPPPPRLSAALYPLITYHPRHPTLYIPRFTTIVLLHWCTVYCTVCAHVFR